jgi:transposase/ferredoxin
VRNLEFIQGENRNQINLLPSSIDEYIDEDNPTRVIDAYVESLDLQALGFEKAAPNETGRPMYSPKDMLKLYVYGYMNRVRSSRRLEAETKRNLEVIWLMNNLIPDHKTIARFRQNNPKALKNVFRDFVALCNKLDLFGKELIAIDGSKFKAWNTKDRNFTKDKLQDRLKRIDDKIAEYLNILNDNDALENESSNLSASDIRNIISNLQNRKDDYSLYLDELTNSDETQLSLTDPDSRLMKTKNGLDVCLNIQTAVDDKNKMVVEFNVENQVQDKNLMSPLAKKSKDILQAENPTIVADNGYDSVTDVAQVCIDGMTPVIAGGDYEFLIETTPEEAETITDYTEGLAHAVYLPDRNVFVCPMGKVLYPSSFNKSKHIARYMNCKACRNCTHKCTVSNYYRAERRIKQSEFSKEYNDKKLYLKRVQIRQNKEIVRQRKSIIEHVFGTVKRAFGISYLLLKGKKKVEGEISLAFLALNIKRAINTLGTKRLIAAIKAA